MKNQKENSVMTKEQERELSQLSPFELKNRLIAKSC